jgi:RNA polymerase sigma-70 factor, ECF subfamily
MAVLGQLDTERRAWLAELYESNFAVVFKTCSKVLRNTEDAADASQEVFVIAADSMQPGTSRAMARAWLQTVARNHCIDMLRRRKRLGKVLVTLGGDGDAQADVAAAVADRDLVGSIFKRLSPLERQALWHSAVERRAVDDIAGRLQLSYMAAAQVISRARRHALQLAARVAIIFGVIRLSRSGRLSLSGVRVAALPMIAVSIVVLQTSVTPISSAGSGAHNDGATIQRSHASLLSGAGGSVSTMTPRPGGTLLPRSVTTDPSSTVGTAVNTVRQSLDAVTGHVNGALSGLGVAVPVPTPPSLPNPKLPGPPLP